MRIRFDFGGVTLGSTKVNAVTISHVTAPL